MNRETKETNFCYQKYFVIFLVVFDSKGDSEMQQLSDEVVKCGTELIEADTFPRSDYLELLELTFVYLGGSVFPFKLRRPGYIK